LTAAVDGRFSLEHTRKMAGLELNPQQQAVVECLEGPLLVVAGAGTGKTRVLAARAAALFAAGIPPERMLILTFTRRAAEEMKRRIAEAAQLPPERLNWCGTFHAMGARFLRLFGKAVGIRPDFTILDEADMQNLLGMILREKVPDRDERTRMPKKSVLARICSWARSRSIPWEQAVHQMTGRRFEAQVPQIVEVFEEYVRRKQAGNVLDYDDLLLKWLELLRAEATRLRTLFDHIMVDEYQDTNVLQASILEELARTHRNIMVVGDDAQAIYGFRGATIENIYRFEEMFPRTIRLPLEENYRSTQHILDLANTLLRHAPRAFQKLLFTTRAGSGERPLLWITASEQEQAERVAFAIYKSWTQERIPLREQAVLFRAAFHSFALEIVLRQYNIPFRKYGGPRLAEAAHIKDVLAFLRCRENPTDEAAWHRVLELLKGVGPATAGRIVRDVTNGGPAPGDVPDRLRRIRWSARTQEAGKAFVAFMEELFGRDDRPPAEEIDLVLTFYKPLLQDLYNFPDSRAADIEELRNVAAEYEDRRTFLEQVQIGEETAVGELAGLDDDDVLTLSTIHSAKGREWDVVYVINLVEGALPAAAAMHSEDRIEEERRLLYVAVTRARKRLVLCRPRTRRQFEHGHSVEVSADPSRFLTPDVEACCEKPDKTPAADSSAASGILEDHGQDLIYDYDE